MKSLEESREREEGSLCPECGTAKNVYHSTACERHAKAETKNLKELRECKESYLTARERHAKAEMRQDSELQAKDDRTSLASLTRRLGQYNWNASNTAWKTWTADALELIERQAEQLRVTFTCGNCGETVPEGSETQADEIKQYQDLYRTMQEQVTLLKEIAQLKGIAQLKETTQLKEQVAQLKEITRVLAMDLLKNQDEEIDQLKEQ